MLLYARTVLIRMLSSAPDLTMTVLIQYLNVSVEKKNLMTEQNVSGTEQTQYM